MTLMTSQHPNARLSSPRNARNAQSSLVSSKRRIFSIVSSRKTTTRVKSFRDENDVESYQTVASFFLSLSLSHEYFFPPKIFLLLSDEKFFSRRTNKNTSKNDTANNASFRSRLHVLFYIL